MDFSFTADQEQLRARIREWAEVELKPKVWRWEDEETLPSPAVHKMGVGGVLGFTLPKAVGGGGHNYLEFAIVLEELGRIGGGLWAFAYFSNLYGRIIDDPAFLRGLCSGQNVVAFAETEPQSGGDAAAIKTTAVRQEGGYVINGRKHLISLIPGANWIIVTALTNPSAGGKRGMSMFLVKADQPGVKTAPIPEPGMKVHMLGYVSLTNVEVPESRIVGEKDRGFYQMRDRWDFTRALGPTASIGNAAAAIELTIEWAKKKKTFGKPLLKWQHLQFKLVDALTKLEAARLLAYKAAWLADNKQRVTAHASMCRLFVGEVTERAHRDALEIMGGRAYNENNEIWRRFASCLAPRLWGGGDGIERVILGTELFGRDFASHK
jgi:cyclohexanecarboxyl-CoA dehydrogenase